MRWLRSRPTEVDEGAVERVRAAYEALGPGFPRQVAELFEQEGDDDGMWRRLAPRGQRRLIEAGELASEDLFSLPSGWEVMRVELRQLSARRDLISAGGFLFCRPRGTWENIRVPFLHNWALCRDKVLTFQSVLDEIELRRADGRTRCAA